MKRATSFLIFVLFCAFFCHAVPDEQRFLKALEAGGPAWMDEQIESDLAPFKDGISKEMVENVFERLPILAKITIRDGAITYITFKQQPNPRLEAYLEALRYLNRLVGLPHIDFVLTMEDSTVGFLPKEENIIFGYGTYVGSFNNEQFLGGGIMIPDFIALLGLEKEDSCVEQGVLKYLWEWKIKKGFWRGSTTGYIANSTGYICGYSDNNWNLFPRTKLVLYSKKRPDIVDAKITNVCQVLPGSKFPCIFTIQSLLGVPVSIGDHLKYRYLIDVDGNGMSVPRCYWVLRSNSLLVKQNSNWVLWYSRGLIPYFNYVPFAEPDIDLESVIEWARAHDDQAREIACEGRRFAIEDLSIENTYLYLYKVLMAYSDLQNK